MERCESRVPPPTIPPTGGRLESEDEQRRKAAREMSAAISRMQEILQKMEIKQVSKLFLGPFFKGTVQRQLTGAESGTNR